MQYNISFIVLQNTKKFILFTLYILATTKLLIYKINKKRNEFNNIPNSFHQM